MTGKNEKKQTTRRQFIRTSALATTGLLLAACGADSLTEVVTPTQTAPPPPLPPHTPVPPTVSPPPTEPSQGSNRTATDEPLPPSTPEPTPDRAQLFVGGLTQAAIQFMESLDPAQREKATYAFTDSERFRWHWTTPGNFPRNGLPLRDMTDAQKTLASTLLEASLSSMGFEKATHIISLQNDLGNDPQLYYITVFGAPGTDEPWGWRWEGHHLSRQFTVVGQEVIMTPFFLGSWPTTTEAGLRAMAHEEDAALELINSMTGSLREMAVFQDRPITQHVTQNAAQVSPLDPVGVLYPDLTAPQQQLVMGIIHAYLDTLPDHLAAASLDRLSTAGVDQIRFGWAGSLEYQRPQYYRLQGPTFLLEYDNTRNGGTHIHSVWRDFEQDFGYHLL